MDIGFGGRVAVLLVAAGLVGGSVMARVWLAAAGGYHEAWAMPVRVTSVVGFVIGLVLAGFAVAWPMRGERDAGSSARAPAKRGESKR